MILLADPRISAVPLGDNGEALVDVRQAAELRVDDRLADEAGAYAHLREATVQRLLDAQRTLPRGLRLLIIEGTGRSAGRWDVTTAGAVRRIREPAGDPRR